ncbi:16S rRNA (cytidine(1402)-2'-O)-methyltransferase [Aerococcaceae bacterium DSM 111020]|nr:16S rRNA (cytidine(1402)-2'-O)-methyltransferase [Aerococcaceae bacterium DSM 111020]
MDLQTSFRGTSDSGKLYLIPTPIGNLEDMTFRAIRLLQEVDLILAEDTRHTIKLLNHFNIQTKMQSFHEHSATHEIQEHVTFLEKGGVIGLVSDAGLPLINDPGHSLVQEALARSIDVISLPGANAALTALIASGLPSERFTYYGFFPRNKKEQKALLELVGQREETALFYESPFRVKNSIQSIVQVLGDQRRIVIARELTKSYEEYLRGEAEEILNHVIKFPLKGEVVLLVQGGGIGTEEIFEELDLKEHVELLMATKGMTSKEAIKQVAKIQNVKKQEVYKAYHIGG